MLFEPFFLFVFFVPLCSAHCRLPKVSLAFIVNSGVYWCYAVRHYTSTRLNAVRLSSVCEIFSIKTFLSELLR